MIELELTTGLSSKSLVCRYLLMVKQDGIIEVEGEVEESLPNANFRVRLDDGRQILAHLAGKIRLYHIKVMPGDRVKVSMSPYDNTKGRITYRMK